MARTHGIRATYLNTGCRCRPCTQANADWYRRYRATPAGQVVHQRTQARRALKRLQTSIARKSRMIEELMAQLAPRTEVSA